MAEDTIRTFVAIELLADIQKVLGEVEEKLKNSQDKISWVKPHNIHITLKFLGNVPKDDISSIEKAISETARGCHPFDIIIKGTGVFPQVQLFHERAGRERSPRVVWVGIIDGQDGLRKLYMDLETRLSLIGYPKEERSFTPHLTLGRVKYIKDIDRFIQSLHKYGENILGKMVVGSISLIKSTLTPKGSIYESLYTAKIE